MWAHRFLPPARRSGESKLRSMNVRRYIVELGTSYHIVHALNGVRLACTVYQIIARALRHFLSLYSVRFYLLSVAFATIISQWASISSSIIPQWTYLYSHFNRPHPIEKQNIALTFPMRWNICVKRPSIPKSFWTKTRWLHVSKSLFTKYFGCLIFNW